MFNFTKETIINSLNIEGKQKFSTYTSSTNGKTMFRVLRCADYYKNNLKGLVYKTNPTTGVQGTAEFTLSTTPGIYRIEMNLKSSTKYLSDFATAVYLFQKPIIVEYSVSAGATAQSVADKAIKGLNLSIPEDNRFITVKNVGNKVLVTVSDTEISVDYGKLLVYKANPAYSNDGEYEVVSNAVITDNIREFGTGDWIEHNLRFPTYPNLRWEALNSEEYPVKGGKYVQYSFMYSVPQEGWYGTGGVGQVMVSETNHVFYVLDSISATFETELKKAFGDGCIHLITSHNLVITGDHTVANDAAAVTINTTISPIVKSPVFTYSLVEPITGVTITGNQLTVATSVEEGTEIKISVKETSTSTEEVVVFHVI